MNHRQQELLLYLLKQTSYQTTKILAKEFSVSERTVQSDLNRIEEYLAKHLGNVQLERKKGTGVKIAAPMQEKQQLAMKVSQQFHSQVFEEEKRLELLVFHLLMAKEAQSLEELAEKLFVSRNEIKKNLEEAHSFFSYHGLTLISKPRIGTLVEGSERKKRELLAQNLKIIQKSDPQTMMLKDFFSKDILAHIQRILREVLLKEKIDYHKELSSIDIHLYFMLERMWQSETVLLSPEEHEFVENTLAQRLSSQLLAKLADVYPVVFSPNEIDYLALRLTSVLPKEEDQQPSMQTEALTTHLIHRVSQLMTMDLNQDETLKQNLMAHLSSTYFRVNHGFSISNPLTKEILRTYTHLFLVIQMVLEEFLTGDALYIPQEEIAYLTVHFQAAFERKKQQRQPKHFEAVLVSQYTRSMATFLEARLNREIPELTIQQVIEYQEGAEENIHAVDFILSTLPLDGAQVPVVLISPMITADDLANILKYMVNHQPRKTKKTFDLARFTSPFLVYPQMNCVNVQELFAHLTHELIENAYVHPDFLTSLIERESRSSTRVAPFIALPHGNPLLVRSSTISIATLREPMDWHGEKVQLVLLLAVRHEELKDPQFKKLFALIQYLEGSPEILRQVFAEENPLKLIHRLSEYE
ncbi:BglG family transcription antiterminator [Enterococcus sp. LJL98]